jgi:hypothetical protein
MTIFSLQFYQSKVELQLIGIVWTCFVLLWVHPCFNLIVIACFTVRSNKDLKVTILQVIFLIVDVMGGC